MRVKLEVCQGPVTGQVLRLRQPDCVVLGRAADSPISFQRDNLVSRHHVLMQFCPPHCKLLDLRSKHGVEVNGVRFWGRRSGGSMPVEQAPGLFLRNGDTLKIGESTLIVSISKPTAAGNDVGEITGEHVFFQDPSPTSEMRAFLEATGSQGMSVFAQTPALAEPAPETPVEMNESFALPEAVEFDGYIIEKTLGQGTLGKVYRAVERDTGERVVIKTQHPRQLPDLVQIQRFQAWQDFVGHVRHPNLANVRRYGRQAHTFYTVYDYVDGLRFDHFLRSQGGQLPVDTALGIMLPILHGLAHAHAAQREPFRALVHNHLHPKHILLVARDDGSWHPVLCELGLSKAFEGIGLSDLTDSSQLVGAPEYWPREYVSHYRHLHPATDVFALAAIFYRAMTGEWIRRGFPEMRHRCRAQRREPTVADFFAVMVRTPATPIREHLAQLPRALARVFDRALLEPVVARSRRREVLARTRYPDAGAFRRALLEAVRQCVA